MTKTTMKTAKQITNAPLSPKNGSVLLFWESGGEGQKLGADFGFKSQQLNFGEIREFLVKSEGNELPFRKEKTRKWRAQISVNAIKIRTTDRNSLANNGNG